MVSAGRGSPTHLLNVRLLACLVASYNPTKTRPPIASALRPPALACYTTSAYTLITINLLDRHGRAARERPRGGCVSFRPPKVRIRICELGIIHFPGLPRERRTSQEEEKSYVDLETRSLTPPPELRARGGRRVMGMGAVMPGPVFLFAPPSPNVWLAGWLRAPFPRSLLGQPVPASPAWFLPSPPSLCVPLSNPAYQSSSLTSRVSITRHISRALLGINTTFISLRS